MEAIKMQEFKKADFAIKILIFLSINNKKILI